MIAMLAQHWIGAIQISQSELSKLIRNRLAQMDMYAVRVREKIFCMFGSLKYYLGLDRLHAERC